MGGTLHTVRCNIAVGLTIYSFFFFIELAGGTLHTVGCNIEVGLTICIFFFFSSELVGGTFHTVVLRFVTTNVL